MKKEKSKMHVQHHTGSQRSITAPAPRSLKQGLVFIYSSDNDLAVSLTMLLEDRFTIVTETDKKKLTEHVRAMLPSVVLVDLPSAPGESLRQISFLKEIPRTIPVVLLRNYRGTEELEREILKLGAFVFFKPFDVDGLCGLITTLLTVNNNSNQGETHGTAGAE